MTSSRSLPTLFALDLRSLALLRVGVALVLLAQLFGVLPDLFALFSDAGVLPRSAAVTAAGPARLSLYFLNGTPMFVALLWGLQLLAALALLVGWRSGLAAVISFIGFASLLNRNPAVATQADALLLCLLFWLCLLPSGLRYAMDALQGRSAAAENAYRSWAVAGLRVQLALVFLVTALMQSGPAWHESLSAWQVALQDDRQAAWLGRALRDSPQVLALLTVGSWWIQLLAPFLLFAPRLPRRLALVALLTLQAALGLLFQLGALPLLAAIGLSAFVGRNFWEWQRRRYDARHPGPMRIYYDEQTPGALPLLRILREFLLLPNASLNPAQDNARARALLIGRHQVVIIDGADCAHLGWDAALALLRHSALLWPLAPLLSRRWIGRRAERLGKRLVRTLLQRLSHTSTASAPAAVRRPVVERVAVAGLLLVLLANLASLQWLPSFLSTGVTAVAHAVRLDQPWQLWSPVPKAEQTWIVVTGRSEDGEEWDVLDPQRGAPQYTPAATQKRPGGQRWQLMEQRLAEPGYAALLPDYARYVCQRWHRQAPQQPLQYLRIVSMLQRSPASIESASAAAEQQIMLRQECSPPSTTLHQS